VSIQMREKAPSILTAEGARRITARIRDALVLADDLLVQAYDGRAWEALGYETWGAYVEAELPSVRLIKALDPEERAEKWAEQVRAGLSQGAVAEGAGVGKATVSRALKGKDLPDTATGLDGKVRSTRPNRSTVERSDPSPAQKQKPSGAAQVRAALVKAGAAGVTTPELVGRLRLHWGVVSGELSRLAKNGRALLPTVTRDGYAVYIDADVLAR
jgi:hypothetical protein